MEGKINKYHIILLISVFFGWAVSATDIVLNAFLINQITNAFHISDATFGIIGIAFGAGDGLGGFLFGRINDLRWGRKLTFLTTLVGVMVFTALTGLSVNFPMYVISRLGAGIFSGGEMTAGWVLLAEQIPTGRRSWFISISQGGVAVGYFLADTFAGTFASPSALGWRAGFLANALFGLAAYLIRLEIRESPLWSRIIQVKALEKASIRQGISEIFKGRYKLVTILAFIGLSAAFFATAFHDYYYEDWYIIGGITRTPLPTLIFTIVFYGFALGHFIANLTEGWFMDKFGTRKAALITFIAVPALILYWLVPDNVSYIADFLILFLVGYGFQTIWGFAPAYMPQIYPTRIRHSGEGVLWALTYGVFYSIAAYLGGIWINLDQWDLVFIISAILIAFYVIFMSLTAIELKGKPLDFLEESESKAK
ncbi:MAG: MFS transporter [Sulfolobus sp.]